MTEEPIEWVSPRMLIEDALGELGIDTPIEELADADIKRVMRFIGMSAADTDISDPDNPKLSRAGIEMMLSATLMVFPDYYMKYELSQFN